MGVLTTQENLEITIPKELVKSQNLHSENSIQCAQSSNMHASTEDHSIQ